MDRDNFDLNRDPNLRAGDADRESIGDRLRQHHADGRIDAEEFHERIERCYAAKTLGELDQLIGDLPGEHHPDQRSYGRPFRRVYIRSMIPFIPILATLVVISALTGWHALWLAFPLFFLSRMWLFRPTRRGVGRWHGYREAYGANERR